MKKSFTLIEILVVSTIISLLALAGFVSYSQFMKESRNAKRKADIELIRSAVEMYRSSNNLYPTSLPVPGLPFGTSGLADGQGNTYMSKIPADPQENITYYYLSDGYTYVMGSYLEGSSAVNCASDPPCGDAKVCNYCMGPYGQL